MEGQNIICCPNCGSNKVKRNRILTMFVIVALGILIIPIIGWILSPFFLILALSGWIVKKAKDIELMKCTPCKHQFQVSPEVYKSYKENVKHA